MHFIFVFKFLLSFLLVKPEKKGIGKNTCRKKQNKYGEYGYGTHT